MISLAHAQGSGGMQGGFSTIIMIVAMLAIFYFLVIRPQQKKQKQLNALINGLQKGDEVLTAGGILGRIQSLDEQYIELEITSSVVMKMQKTSVVNVLPKGTVKATK